MYGPDQKSLIDYLKALGHPVRLRLVEILGDAEVEMGVNELARALRMSQPRVSWHLSLLTRGSVVSQRKEGRQVLCSMDWEGMRRCQRMLWEVSSPRRRSKEPSTAWEARELQSQRHEGHQDAQKVTGELTI
jgi:DNA-binding transcriptional ArsR family regulator